MKWFYDLKISTKLISSFLLVLALTGAMGGFAIHQLGAVNHAAQDIKGNWMPSCAQPPACVFLPPTTV